MRIPATALALAAVAAAATLHLPPLRAAEEEAAKPNGILRVLLVRSRTGKPVPGRMTVTGPAGLSREAAAGPEGRARIDGLPRCVPLDVSLSSPGLLPRRLRGIVLLPAEDTHLGTVPLGLAVPLPVVVRDEEEAPVPGASVQVLDATTPWGIAGDGPPLASATTGEDGRAAVAGLPPGRFTIVVRARGLGAEIRELDLVEGSRSAPLNFTMGPALRLDGRVLDAEGRPAGGIEVALHSSHGAAAGTLVGIAKADARGGFRFEDLGQGQFAVAARLADGALEGVGRVQAPSDVAEEFRIPARGEIRGRVVDDATGRPLGGSTLGVWATAYGVWEPGRYLESAADGTFRISGFPLEARSRGKIAGEAVLSIFVDKPGYLQAGFLTSSSDEPAPRIVPEGSPADPANSWEIRLRRGGAVLRGVVKDRAGKPVPDAWVSLGHGDPRGAWSRLDSFSEEDGTYRMPPAPAGPGILFAGAYGLHLSGMGRDRFDSVPPEREIEMPASGEVERDLLLVPDSAVEGRMVLADGSPAEGFVPELSGGTGNGTRGAPSAADGSFSIEELEEGGPHEKFQVVAYGPSGEVGRSEPFGIAEGAKVTGISIRVVQPASLAGRVVGPGGTPVPHAWVRLLAGRPDPGVPWDGEMPGSDGEWVDVDPDGTFHEDDLAAGTWTPYASAPGFRATRGEHFEVAQGAKREGIVLTLAAGMSAEGVVLDPSGAPAAGSLVMAYEDPRPTPEGEGRFVSVLMKPGGTGAPSQSVESGPDGRFRITGLREGKQTFAAVGEGFVGASVRGTAGETGITIRLAPAFAIAGRVVDFTGAPVAEARVRASALTESGKPVDDEGVPLFSDEALLASSFPKWDIEGLVSMISSETAADGAFRIEGLAKGRFRVVAEKSDQRDAWVDVEAGATDVVLRFGRSAAISGRVLEAGTGRPVKDATVRAIPGPRTGGPSIEPQDGGRETTSGDDGAFAIEALEEGTYSLRIEQRGSLGEQDFLARTLRGVQAGAKDLVVEVDRGLAISGRVTDAGGGEFRGEGLLVGILRAGEPVPTFGGASSALASDGRFTFTGLLPGRYSIRISPSAWGDGEGSAYAAAEIEADAGTSDLVVPLPRGLAISGRVVASKGVHSIEDPVWLVLRRAGGTGRGAIADDVHLREDGSFVTPPLDPAARFDLHASAGEDGVAVARGVKPGDTGVTLKIEPGLSIAGKVVGPDGRGVPSARVEACARVGDGRESGAFCEEDGSFLLERLAPGSYLLYACSNEENLAPVEPEAPVAAGSEGAIVRTVAGNEFRARFVHHDGKALAAEEYSVWVEQSEAGQWLNFTCPLREDGRFVLGGLGKCRIRLQVVRNGEGPDLDDPQAPGTFGFFDVPGPERTLKLDE